VKSEKQTQSKPNKPKTKPILSAVGGLQMNVNAFLQKDYENEPPSSPKKTNPKQTQFKPNLNWCWTIDGFENFSYCTEQT